MSSGYDKVDTTMNGISTIVAMPQWNINFNLGRLLNKGKTTDGQSLKEVSFTVGQSNKWLRGIVSSLQTKVFVADSPTKVTFIVSFQSGTMDYTDLNQAAQTCDIGGLQIGFQVDLSYADVQADETIPPDVKAGVDQLITNLGPGAFTIGQLFMDFENAVLAKFDPTVTIFPASMPPEAQADFLQYMLIYMQQLRSAGGHILGYAIKVGNPGNQPDLFATFPPTNLEFVTNQYQPGANPTSSDLQPDIDTVNYLMMTNNLPFPTNLPLWFGNFVVPGDFGTGVGTMAIAKLWFVDQFLLQRLAPLVLKYWKLSDDKHSLAPNYTEVAAHMFEPIELGGLWQSGKQSSFSHKTNQASNDDAYYNFNWRVEVDVSPGTNQITIWRQLNFDIRVKHWYGAKTKLTHTSSCHVWYEVPLKITITLGKIVGGQLQVDTTSETTQPDPNTVYGDPYGWYQTKVEGNTDTFWKAPGDTMTSVIDKAVTAAIPEGLLGDINKAIHDDLKFAPFIFPGGSQLFMLDPVFNSEGDLLIGLNYKS